MAAVPPAPQANSLVDNPNVGNFNPGTKSWQEIFEEKTKKYQGGKPPHSNKEVCSGHLSFIGK